MAPNEGHNLLSILQVYSKHTPSSQKDPPFIQACIQHDLRLLGLSQCISPLFIAAVARYGLQKFTRLYLTTEYCDTAPVSLVIAAEYLVGEKTRMDFGYD